MGLKTIDKPEITINGVKMPMPKNVAMTFNPNLGMHIVRMPHIFSILYPDTSKQKPIKQLYFHTLKDTKKFPETLPMLQEIDARLWYNLCKVITHRVWKNVEAMASTHYICKFCGSSNPMGVRCGCS